MEADVIDVYPTKVYHTKGIDEFGPCWAIVISGVDNQQIILKFNDSNDCTLLDQIASCALDIGLKLANGMANDGVNPNHYARQWALTVVADPDEAEVE